LIEYKSGGKLFIPIFYKSFGRLKYYYYICDMKLIQFIYNDNIIAQQSADMHLNRVDEIKWLLAEAYKCFPDDIETRYIQLEVKPILSNYDVSNKGIVSFNSNQPTNVKGVIMNLADSDDEFLDAIQGKNIDRFVEKHLQFKF